MGVREFRFKLKRKLRVENLLVRNFFSEFLGTFILIVFGVGVNAQTTLGKSATGDFLSVNLGWGWGLAMGIWASGGVSGGHLNPAVSCACVILGRLKLVMFPVYVIAQLLGAFVGSACVYGVYYEAIRHFDNGTRAIRGPTATAGIFATYPQEYLSTMAGFGDQVFGTMLLVIGVMAITDRYNTAPGSNMTPLAAGGLLTVIGMSFGLNCGYAINPARDFGPRAFTACAGWGVDVFTEYDYWFWVPLVAPFVGALAGAWAYQILVGIHTEAAHEETEIVPMSIDTKDLHSSKNGIAEYMEHDRL